MKPTSLDKMPVTSTISFSGSLEFNFGTPENAAFVKGAEWAQTLAAELPAADAIDTIFRACHGLDEDLKSRRATGPEVCLMECRARLVAAGVG